MQLKTCSRCGEEKDLSLFQIRRASKDGYTASCKKCLSDYDKTRANKPSRVAARKEYAKSERGIEARRRSSAAYVERHRDKVYASKQKWIDQNPKKRKVHGLVSYAVRIGILKKEPCQECGSINSVAHHDDYDQPLVVRWLCQEHHQQWHAINGEGKNG